MRRASTLLATLALSLALVPRAHAQSAAAEALFQEGRALIASGKLEAGCDKLSASERVEPSVGTLLNLGDCREKLGQTATAWAAFRKAEALARRSGNDKRRLAEARRRAAKLERELSHLVIQVGPRATTSTPGLVIKRDGEAVDTAMFDTPLPVDPGPHTIVAEAPGHTPFATEITVGKGGRRYVVIPTLEREQAPAPAPVADTRATPDAPTTAPDTVVTPTPAPPTAYASRDTWTTTRSVAVGIGVLGAVAVGAGIYFGTNANDLEDQSNALCPETTCGDPEGLRLNDEAQSEARRANYLFLAGGAAIAAATVMWFVGAPDEETIVTPTLSSDGVGAALRGRF